MATWGGIGPGRVSASRFDFIIIHESAHEWFGNSITAADRSDMWIHEGWATYMESLYVESRWGHADALKYLNGLKPKVKNLQPIIPRGESTARRRKTSTSRARCSSIRCAAWSMTTRRWWALLHGFYQHFKYQNIMTEDVVGYFNQQTGMNLTPIFNQYLRHAALPVLELQWDPGESPLPVAGRCAGVRDAGAGGQHETLAENSTHDMTGRRCRLPWARISSRWRLTFTT